MPTAVGLRQLGPTVKAAEVHWSCRIHRQPVRYASSIGATGPDFRGDGASAAYWATAHGAGEGRPEGHISREPPPVPEGEGPLPPVPAEPVPAGVGESTLGSMTALLAAPVAAVANGLDALHFASGAPWWLVLAGSTLAVRLALLPLTVAQVRAASKLALLGPQLPAPIPLPGSKKGWRDSWREFEGARRRLGAPSLAWLVAAPVVQIPVFLTWTLSLRYMALSSHPGFSTGGALWFVDLTAPAQGALGAVLPVLIAVTYFASIQASFRGARPVEGVFGTALLFYRWFLEFMALPTLLTAMVLPQGVHIYWLTNGVFSLSQILLLKAPSVRQMLGVPTLEELGRASAAAEAATKRAQAELATDSGRAHSADELVVLAAARTAQKDVPGAIGLLQQAVKQDAHHSSAHIALGQLHAAMDNWAEAAAYYSRAITLATSCDVRLAGMLGAGVALAKQGRTAEAMDLLRVAAELNPGADMRSQRRHGQALVSLASLLSQEGRKEDALTYLRRAAKYDDQITAKFIRPSEAELEAAREGAQLRPDEPFASPVTK